ncbi:carbohydrate esterase family 3 protein [Xylariaceae sp. AK1471]|nr:carbohydrate esterase family 3 protein [Xylariaceae sp. AK1471]
MMILPGPYKFLPGLALIFVLIGFLFFSTANVDQHWHRFAEAIGHKNENSSVANGMPLRIMCIGASVTRGEQSAGDRGYRKHIRDKLTFWGNPVNYVGFNRLGDWEDNDVEGYGAQRIRQIHQHAMQAVPVLQPNLILMQVGTNDCFQKDDTTNILPRMRDLVDYMLEASPEVTVILSTLITTPNLDFEPCMLSANAQIRQVYNDLNREKKKVALAEMHYNQGLLGRPMPEDIGGDRIHPTNEGYIMMGEIFLEKIREVERKGYLQPPAKNDIPDNGDDGLSREVEDRIRETRQAEHPLKARRKRTS